MVSFSAVPFKKLSLGVLIGFAALVAQAAPDAAYDAQIIKDYTARGYFISNAIEDMLYPETTGLKDVIIAGGSTPEDSAENIKYMKPLNAALDRLPQYGEAGKTLVYRGIYSDKSKYEKEIFVKGRVWKERRYSSSTSSLKVAESFAAGLYKNEGCGGCPVNAVNPVPRNMIVITIVNRTGKDIKGLAAEAEEKEVLFKSGTVFKVVNAVRDARKRLQVSLAELDEARLSADDKAKLAAEEQKRLALVVKTNFDGDIGKLRSMYPLWQRAHEAWLGSGYFEKNDIDFEARGEGG